MNLARGLPLLAVGIAAVVVVGLPAGAADSLGSNPIYNFSCDVDTTICECKGDARGADCKAMRKNCEGISRRKDDKTGWECCMNGGLECFDNKASVGQNSGVQIDWPEPGQRKGGSPFSGAELPGSGPKRPAGSAASPQKTKTFPFPKDKGKRLNYCLTKGANCGFAAAQKFCARHGFPVVDNFRQDHDIGRSRRIGDGSTCKKKTCDGFQSITCANRLRDTPPDTGPIEGMGPIN